MSELTSMFIAVDFLLFYILIPRAKNNVLSGSSEYVLLNLIFQTKITVLKYSQFSLIRLSKLNDSTLAEK